MCWGLPDVIYTYQLESTQSCVNEVEDFVIFEYEGELFPDQVTVVKHNGCEIKSMAKSF